MAGFVDAPRHEYKNYLSHDIQGVLLPISDGPVITDLDGLVDEIC